MKNVSVEVGAASSLRRRLLPLAVVSGVAGLAIGAAPTWHGTSQPVARPPAAQFVAVASTAQPKGELAPVARLDPVPAAGTVTRVLGPFDDRFTLADLRLSAGIVTSNLRVTSDVSEIINFEITAAFYDAQGLLLGTSSQQLAEGDGSAGKPTAENAGVPLRLTADPAYLARVASAQVRVPVMVNE